MSIRETKITIVDEETANRRIVFCNNLREMIRNGPLSAAKVAAKIGISTGTVYSYMRGWTYPSDERIEELAAALECTKDDLFDETYAPWKFGEPLED